MTIAPALPPASGRAPDLPIERRQATTEPLPVPAFALTSIYAEGEGEPRLRRTALPHDVLVEFEILDRQIAWSDLSASSAARYRGIVANFWQCCLAHGRDRWSIDAAWEYLYTLAYPRLLYLQLLAQGAPPDPRGHQPGVGRATITVTAAAISKAFVAGGRLALAAHPQWNHRMGGLLRRLRQVRDRKAPILRDDLIAAVNRARAARSPLVQLRDAALMLLGWSCALRRSELVAVDLEHIQEQPTGWVLWVPHSKTDQHGRGRAIPLYPASTPELDARLACQDWAAAAAIDQGPLFRPIDRLGRVQPGRLTARSVATILQDYSTRDNVSGHSLRIGFVTQGGIDGKDNHALRIVTGHTNDAMLNEYRRVIDPSKQGPGSLL